MGSDILFTFLGAVIGTFLGFFVMKYYGVLDYIFTKKSWWFEKIFTKLPLTKKENNIYDTFISFDKSLQEFSGITNDILVRGKKKYKVNNKVDSIPDNSITITNIQEPYWYWKEFKNKFTPATSIGEKLNTLETMCGTVISNIEDIKTTLNEISDEYYENPDLHFFPHQVFFKNFNSKSIFRLNIFKAVFKNNGRFNENISEATSINSEWKSRNPVHSILLFEKIFSQGVDNRIIHPFHLSLYNSTLDNINEYISKFSDKDYGTDAIIFSNEQIYNYDPEIGAITYLKINKLKQPINSFFNRVENTRFRNLTKFSDLLKNYELTEVQINQLFS